MDALLMFDVLIYLNAYYYPFLALCNVGMWSAKYTSTVFPTPNIERDAIVQVVLVLSELLKLLVFRKLREERQGLAVVIAVLFTLLTGAGLFYVLMLQKPVLKLEYALDALMSALAATEVFFGIGVFIPACKKKEYA